MSTHARRWRSKPGQSLKGDDVVRVLNRVKLERAVPKVLFCDNGSEFTSQAMDLWAYRNGVKIDFSRPGKPTDNAFVESFNGTFRAECLDTHWFADLKEAKQLIESWRREYNESRPHASLGDRTRRARTPAQSHSFELLCGITVQLRANRDFYKVYTQDHSHQSANSTLGCNHEIESILTAVLHNRGFSVTERHAAPLHLEPRVGVRSRDHVAIRMLELESEAPLRNA